MSANAISAALITGASSVSPVVSGGGAFGFGAVWWGMGGVVGWMECAQSEFQKSLRDLTLNPRNALISASVSDAPAPFQRARCPTMGATPLAAPCEGRPHP